MKSLYQRSNARRNRVLVVTTALVLGIFALDAFSGGSIRAIVRSSGTYAWRAGAHVASAVSGSGVLSSRRALVEDNEKLKNEVGRLQLRIAELVILESENVALREMVRLADELPGTTVPITSSLRASPYGTFTIGAGRSEGIAVGDAVLAAVESGRGFVVGRVSEVAAHHALVSRLFSPGVSVEALINGTPIALEGRGGGNAHAEAPRSLAIEEGDVVTSPEFGGMALGVVGSASSEPASASQDVFIGLPVNLATLTFVYVVGR